MFSQRRMALLMVLACTRFTGLHAQQTSNPELEARPVKFPASPVTLQEALKLLEQHTGNAVADLRTNPDHPKLTLKSNPFWKTLDAIGKETGIPFSAYQQDGGVALVNGDFANLRTHYSGMFRFAFKRVSVQRDEETRSSQCDVTLDVAWEPRLQAYYLNLEQALARHDTKDRETIREEKLPATSAHSVANARATEIVLRMRAPERATRTLATLSGKLRVIGAPKMLEFAFAKPASAQQKKDDGVRVQIVNLDARPGKDLWTFDVETEYPKNAIVALDSFQAEALIYGNRIWLSWTDSTTKTTRTLTPSGFEPLDSKTGTRIRHQFTPHGKTPLPPSAAEVTLHYRAPSRVIAFTVPFEFQDLPLP